MLCDYCISWNFLFQEKIHCKLVHLEKQSLYIVPFHVECCMTKHKAQVVVILTRLKPCIYSVLLILIMGRLLCSPSLINLIHKTGRNNFSNSQWLGQR